MHRILLQTYTQNSKEAVPFYCKVFDTKPISTYLNDDGSYYHCELPIDTNGTVLAVAQSKSPVANGGTMQFCLHYTPQEKDIVTVVYEGLKQGAALHHPLGPTDYSDYMFDLTDRYGVRWCGFC